MTPLQFFLQMHARKLSAVFLALCALLAPWVAAQFCIPTCKCENALTAPSICPEHLGGPSCFSSQGGYVSYVFTNTLNGCCALLGSCNERACQFDLTITAEADPGESCCFYITSFDTTTTVCLAGDCACVCTVSVQTLSYTGTGLTLACGESINYFVSVCGVDDDCFKAVHTFQVDAIWRLPHLCSDC